MRGALLAALVLAVLPPALMGQERTVSPHGELKLECDACHQGGTWSAVRIGKQFDHRTTGFPLSGAHEGAACRACHASVDFAGAPATCAGCHEDLHRGELGADCARCHTPRSFLDRSAMARAHQATRFPLNGGHLTADCSACHRPTDQGRLRFVALGTECWNCHEVDYSATRTPNHPAANLPHTCQQCHGTVLWTRGRFNHDRTLFPLTGAHRATPCLQCHGDNVYAGKPTACVACHQARYDATTTPPHTSVGFGTDCERCHTTVRWDQYDHNRSAFPLTGTHIAVPCAQCHVNNVYAGTPTACASCHQAAYDATTNPSHTALGFSSDCAACHAVTIWTDGKYPDHDALYFPIYSRRHKGLWTGCVTCHTNPLSYVEFTCFSCHTHNQTKTDDIHKGKSGYAYLSTECVRCHPRP